MSVSQRCSSTTVSYSSSDIPAFLQQLMATNFVVHELKEGGFTAQDLRDFGLEKLEDARRAGVALCGEG